MAANVNVRECVGSGCRSEEKWHQLMRKTLKIKRGVSLVVDSEKS